MARLLVVSRSMALAMRLADAHEVIEHPMEQAAQLAPGDDIDAVVLDVGEPAAAILALDRLRGSGYTTPVLVVSGYQPSWSGLVAIDLPAVVVVPLPITKAALLHGVDELTGGRPNRAPAPPPRGWNGPRPAFVPAPTPAPLPPQPTLPATPAVETTSWTALVAPSWNELTGTTVAPPASSNRTAAVSGAEPQPVEHVESRPAEDFESRPMDDLEADESREVEPTDDETSAPEPERVSVAPNPGFDAARAEDADKFEVTADLTDPDTFLPPSISTPAPAGAFGQGAPVAGSGWPAVPFAPAPWALHQASGDHRGRPHSRFTPHPTESTDHAALLQRPGDRLSVEGPSLTAPAPEVAIAVGWPGLVDGPSSTSPPPGPPALTGFERPSPENPVTAEPAAGDPAAALDDTALHDRALHDTALHDTAHDEAAPDDTSLDDAMEPAARHAVADDANPHGAATADPIGRVIDLDAVAHSGGWAAQDFDWWRPLPDDAETQPDPTTTDAVAGGDLQIAVVQVGADQRETSPDEVWVTDDVPTVDSPTSERPTDGGPPSSTPLPLPVAPAQQLSPPPLPVTPPAPVQLSPPPLPIPTEAPPLPVRVRGAVPEAPPPFEAFPPRPDDEPAGGGHGVQRSAPVATVASPPQPASPSVIDTSLFEPTDDTWQRQLAAARAAARDRGEVPADDAEPHAGQAPEPTLEAVTPAALSGGAGTGSAPTGAPNEPAAPSYTLRSAQEVSESIAARRALLGRPDLVPAPSMLSRRLAGRTPATDGLFSPVVPPARSTATTSSAPEEPTASRVVDSSVADSSVDVSRVAPAATVEPLRVPVPHEPGPDAAGAPVVAVDDDLPAAALVTALSERFDELFGVGDTAQVLADEILDRVRAEAVAVVVADGSRWRVAGGIGLRPLERRLALPADHWLIAEVSDDGHAVLIGDTDAIRPSLAGAPLAAWHYLLAVPVPGHQAIVVLARGPQAEPFETGDVARLAPPVREAAALLRTALQTRALARRMASLRDLAGPLA